MNIRYEVANNQTLTPCPSKEGDWDKTGNNIFHVGSAMCRSCPNHGSMDFEKQIVKCLEGNL